MATSGRCCKFEFLMSKDGNTTLTMTMDAKAYKLLSKLMNLLTKSMITKAVEKDMDLVKAYCENIRE